MRPIALAIICKTPSPGKSKTRLSPPLRPEECAAISACFIADLGATIAELAATPAATAHAVYTPAGSEAALAELLPGFGLTLQGEGDLGARLLRGIADLIAAGHGGAVVVNSDGPTLPPSLLRAGMDALASGAAMVISPAIDGGYTFIGLATPHARLFEDIPWSTEAVFALTMERAREIGIEPVVLPPWYDVDDAHSYAMLEAELDGAHPAFADANTPLRDAPRTRAFVTARRAQS